MSIAGTGIDIVCTSRFDPARVEALAGKMLTKREAEYCRSRRDFILHMSGRIAAKEAFFKAANRIDSSLSWKDIEVTSRGVPGLSGECRAYRVLESRNLQCSLSISHDTGYAVAHALIWSKE